MQRSRTKTERPREALLQANIVFWYSMRSIGGRLRSLDFGRGGAISEIPLLL